jgi:hypothetical protein
MAEYYNQVANAIKETIKQMDRLAQKSWWSYAGGGIVGYKDCWEIPAFADWWMFSGLAWVDNLLARVSPWELILNRSQQENLAGQLNRGNQIITINIAPTIYWNEDDYAEKIWDKIVEMFKSHTRTESY